MSDIEKQFKKLVEAHDMTYMYSDDHGVWQRGNKQRDEIRAVAAQLPIDTVKRIWNAQVDKTFEAATAKEFYWIG